MGIMSPITEITSPMAKFLFGNPMSTLAHEEILKAKSSLMKKYILYSTNFLYVAFLVAFSIAFYYMHLSRFNFMNPYFNWDVFITETFANILLVSLIVGVPYLLLNLVNAIFILIVRKRT